MTSRWPPVRAATGLGLGDLGEKHGDRILIRCCAADPPAAATSDSCEAEPRPGLTPSCKTLVASANDGTADQSHFASLIASLLHPVLRSAPGSRAYTRLHDATGQSRR